MGRLIRRSSRWGGLLLLAGGIAIVLCGGACMPATNRVPPISGTEASTSTATFEQRDERDVVADAYTRFWPRLHEAAGQPDSRWPELMREVAADPQLSRTLNALRQQRVQGRTLYGAEVARVSEVEVSGDRATVRDCQDASQAGQADVNTGDRKTVGVARNPVSAVLVRGPDGKWRVVEISYPGGSC